jgi:hypothetical protein
LFTHPFSLRPPPPGINSDRSLIDILRLPVNSIYFTDKRQRVHFNLHIQRFRGIRIAMSKLARFVLLLHACLNIVLNICRVPILPKPEFLNKTQNFP